MLLPLRTGMVSDKKVFPTKDSWVSLERQPIIPDSKELEKVFKHHNICLLSLPPPDKKAPPRSKSGNNGASLHVHLQLDSGWMTDHQRT